MHARQLSIVKKAFLQVLHVLALSFRGLAHELRGFQRREMYNIMEKNESELTIRRHSFDW